MNFCRHAIGFCIRGYITNNHTLSADNRALAHFYLLTSGNAYSYIHSLIYVCKPCEIDTWCQRTK